MLLLLNIVWQYLFDLDYNNKFVTFFKTAPGPLEFYKVYSINSYCKEQMTVYYDNIRYK